MSKGAHWAGDPKGWWHIPALAPFAGAEIFLSHICGWPLEGLSARPSLYLRECRPYIPLSTVRFTTCGLVYELRSLWFQDVESSRRARHRPTGATPARWTCLPPASSSPSTASHVVLGMSSVPFAGVCEAFFTAAGHTFDIYTGWMQRARDCARLKDAARQQVSVELQTGAPSIEGKWASSGTAPSRATPASGGGSAGSRRENHRFLHHPIPHIRASLPFLSFGTRARRLGPYTFLYLRALKATDHYALTRAATATSCCDAWPPWIEPGCRLDPLTLMTNTSRAAHCLPHLAGQVAHLASSSPTLWHGTRW